MSAKRTQLEAMSPGACGLVPVRDLLSLFALDIRAEERLSTDDMARIASHLSAHGFGIEPDPRFAGPLPLSDASVIIFRQPEVSASTFEFLLARTEIEIAALVAAHDGQIDGEECLEIVAKVKSMQNLSASDKVRLLAYLGYLTANPPSNKAIKQIEKRDLRDRNAVADAAVAAVATKVEVRQSDIKFLERTFDKLNLPKQAVQAKIESLRTRFESASEMPPLIRVGEAERGVPIPPRKTAETATHVKLDGQRILEIQADTRRVSEILGGIFDIESGPENQSQESTVAEIINTLDKGDIRSAHADRFPGLESRHAKLLCEIWESAALDREQFEQLARKHGLMPSGAIEIINDWSFELFEEPLLDEGSLIEIARHLLPDVSRSSSNRL